MVYHNEETKELIEKGKKFVEEKNFYSLDLLLDSAREIRGERLRCKNDQTSPYYYTINAIIQAFTEKQFKEFIDYKIKTYETALTQAKTDEEKAEAVVLREQIIDLNNDYTTGSMICCQQKEAKIAYDPKKLESKLDDIEMLCSSFCN